MSNSPSHDSAPQKSASQPGNPATLPTRQPKQARMSLLHLNEFARIPPISGVPLEAPLYICIQSQVPRPSYTQVADMCVDDHQPRVPLACIFGTNKVEVIKLQLSASLTMRDLLEMISTRLLEMVRFRNGGRDIGKEVKEMLEVKGVTVLWDWKFGTSVSWGETQLDDGNLRGVWGLLQGDARKGKDVLLLRCGKDGPFRGMKENFGK